jgi:hypothetical protein
MLQAMHSREGSPTYSKLKGGLGLSCAMLCLWPRSTDMPAVTASYMQSSMHVSDMLHNAQQSMIVWGVVSYK